MNVCRLRLCSALAVALVALPTVASADRSERVTTGADIATLNVTIYNGTISLVHDRRTVELTEGENRLAWRDVSAMMDPTTAVLNDLTSPGATRVVEQNFDFDLINPATILDKYVGRDVIVVHDSPVFVPARETAKLLSDNDGIVLQYGDRIETGLTNAHLAYPALPPGLRDRPTLTLGLESSRAAKDQLDLAYLTSGLAWHADYVGVVSPNETSMQLGGLVTLSNTSGTSYPNARIQLVAGNVNVPAPPQTVLRTIGRVSGRENGLPDGVAQENYFEYHLYTLARATSIENKQTKQVALLHASGIAIRKTLELRGSASYYSNRNADLGQNLKIGVYVAFVNKAGDLGIPLPAGTVRLYKSDRAGTSISRWRQDRPYTPLRRCPTPRRRLVRRHREQEADGLPRPR